EMPIFLKRAWRSLALLALLPMAVSCGGDDTSGPALPRGLSPGWNEMNPGGATTCALGAPYAFWVRPGTVNRLVIDFQGGGTCWDASTVGLTVGNADILPHTSRAR